MFTSQSSASGSSGSGALIPHGTLAFAVVKPTGIKESKRTGGTYANLELTISDGPFTGRKVWTIVMNPQDDKNQNHALRAEGKNDGALMGLASMCRMFEAAGVFNPLDARSYDRYNGASFNQVIAGLEGLTVAIKVKISKGKDGYEDKNEVAEFLSPAPTSGTSKLWAQLTGDGSTARKSAFGQPAFGAPAQAPVQPQVRPVAPQPPVQPSINNGPKWITKRPNGDLGLDNAGNNPF
jgi:hypothetical protein